MIPLTDPGEYEEYEEAGDRITVRPLTPDLYERLKAGRAEYPLRVGRGGWWYEVERRRVSAAPPP